MTKPEYVGASTSNARLAALLTEVMGKAMRYLGDYELSVIGEAVTRIRELGDEDEED